MIFQEGCGTLGPGLFRVPRSPNAHQSRIARLCIFILHYSSFPKKIIKKEQNIKTYECYRTQLMLAASTNNHDSFSNRFSRMDLNLKSSNGIRFY